MNKIGRLRISTAIGYLSAARARPNLTKIQANAHIHRIVFEGSRAVGVEVERKGELAVIRGRAIVLSAGAIQSPAILMRSGVGPKDELARHGIDLRSDAPAIGTRLSDHPALAVACRVKDPGLLDADQPIVQTILRYTAPGSEHRNDLQIEAFSFSPRGGPLTNFAIAAVLEQVNGTGTLRLASADPYAAPVIEQRFCEDERDRSRLAACLRDAIAFVKAGPLASIIAEQTFPDPRRTLSAESLGELSLRLSASGFHPCATVPMGPDGAVDRVRPPPWRRRPGRRRRIHHVYSHPREHEPDVDYDRRNGWRVGSHARSRTLRDVSHTTAGGTFVV